MRLLIRTAPGPALPASEGSKDRGCPDSPGSAPCEGRGVCTAQAWHPARADVSGQPQAQHRARAQMSRQPQAQHRARTEGVRTAQAWHHARTEGVRTAQAWHHVRTEGVRTAQAWQHRYSGLCPELKAQCKTPITVLGKQPQITANIPPAVPQQELSPPSTGTHRSAVPGYGPACNLFDQPNKWEAALVSRQLLFACF